MGANGKQTLLGLEFVGSNSRGRNPQNSEQNRKTSKKIKELMKKSKPHRLFFLHFLIFSREERISPAMGLYSFDHGNVDLDYVSLEEVLVNYNNHFI